MTNSKKLAIRTLVLALIFSLGAWLGWRAATPATIDHESGSLPPAPQQAPLSTSATPESATVSTTMSEPIAQSLDPSGAFTATPSEIEVTPQVVPITNPPSRINKGHTTPPQRPIARMQRVHLPHPEADRPVELRPR